MAHDSQWVSVIILLFYDACVSYNPHRERGIQHVKYEAKVPTEGSELISYHRREISGQIW